MSVITLSNNLLHQDLGRAVQAGATANKPRIEPTRRADNGELSPFARVLGSLQNLQQTDPVKYKEVTRQVAANLKDAAAAAQSNGDTTSANLFSQLSTDFSGASETGELPNIEDLARAARPAGHHRRDHHVEEASNRSSDDSATGPQISIVVLAAFGTGLSQSDVAQGDGANPLSIIEDTLSKAGVGG